MPFLGLGPGADWLRYIETTANPEVIIGSDRFIVARRVLDEQEAARVITGYELAAAPAVIDRRQRQQPPCLIGVVRPLRQLPQLRRVVIPRTPIAAAMANPHSFATVNHFRASLGTR